MTDTQRIEDVPASPAVEPRNMAPWPVVPKVYRAINAVTKAIGKVGISKDRKNVQQSYAFRGIDDMYNALSPFLAEHGLCILPRMLSRSQTERESAKGGALFVVVVDAEFDFVCAEDASKHTVRTYGEAMDSADKATNKAMSAAYKYACMQTFSIPTEGDNDADSTTHVVKPATPMPVEEMTPAQMTRLAKVAHKLTDLVTEEEDPTVDNEWRIWEIIEPITDNEEQLYLSTLLGSEGSRTRSRMKEIIMKKRGEFKAQLNTTRVQTGPGLKKTHVRNEVVPNGLRTRTEDERNKVVFRDDAPNHPAQGESA